MQAQTNTLTRSIQVQRILQVIDDLEREKAKLNSEASEASARYVEALEELKLREMAIGDLHKRIAEGEHKLKQQQQLYEAARADRNVYSKNLIEVQDDVSEMRRRFAMMVGFHTLYATGLASIDCME